MSKIWLHASSTNLILQNKIRRTLRTPALSANTTHPYLQRTYHEIFANFELTPGRLLDFLTASDFPIVAGPSW